MKPLRHPLREKPFADWPLAVKSILGFWLFYALTVIARAFLSSDPFTILQNRLFVLLIGIAVTAVIYLAIALLGGNTLRRRAIVAGIGSFIGALLMAFLLLAIDHRMKESKEERRYQAREGFVIIERGHTIRIERSANEPLVLTLPELRDLDRQKQIRLGADTAVIWLFFFAAWSAFYLAMVAQAQALTAQRRAAEAEGAAQAAQLRALRYQINPHFLFNTLNSLSSLVMTGRNDRAESMLLALSTFFRSSLSLDPSADVTLAQEIDLQRLYLDIEKSRFPERLHVELEIPEDLTTAKLPALILQPVIENAIKYGVSATRQKVVITISAERLDDGRMTVTVTNKLLKGGELPVSPPAHEGTGVGLVNVCQRLEARFRSKAECRYGAIQGGYKVALTMPVQTDD